MREIKSRRPPVSIHAFSVHQLRKALATFTTMTSLRSVILLAVALIQLSSSASVPPACTSLQHKFPKSVFQTQNSDYNTQTARGSDLDERLLSV